MSTLRLFKGNRNECNLRHDTTPTAPLPLTLGTTQLRYLSPFCQRTKEAHDMTKSMPIKPMLLCGARCLALVVLNYSDLNLVETILCELINLEPWSFGLCGSISGSISEYNIGFHKLNFILFKAQSLSNKACRLPYFRIVNFVYLTLNITPDCGSHFLLTTNALTKVLTEKASHDTS
ncbi:hypothetical protein G4B88_003231 [Cannabis sativa]|uniref:Uncharacterized protein n=1 Tax=Cannabis sativa TaxID=3483 RepID=A0A7J6I6M2_CANSA|nr:hypothetical protein G4B88_003231 [Cannabis sativa]